VIACMLRGVPPFLCLQVAEAAALLLLQQSWPDDTPAGAVSLPAAAALAQARLQQAAVCLQLAQADARHATADAAAKRPKYPRVPEKDAAVVEGYVDVEVQQVQEARKEQQEEVSHLTLTSPTPSATAAYSSCCAANGQPLLLWLRAAMHNPLQDAAQSVVEGLVTHPSGHTTPP
jgi:hypothetical protein